MQKNRNVRIIKLAIWIIVICGLAVGIVLYAKNKMSARVPVSADEQKQPIVKEMEWREFFKPDAFFRVSLPMNWAEDITQPQSVNTTTVFGINFGKDDPGAQVTFMKNVFKFRGKEFSCKTLEACDSALTKIVPENASVKDTQIDGQPARKFSYIVLSGEGGNVAISQTIFVKDGNFYHLLFTADPTTVEKYESVFEKISNEFRIL